MSKTSGITFGYRRLDTAVLVDVGPDKPFKPFHLWWLQECLSKQQRVYPTVRIEKGHLRIELPHFGVASSELVQYISAMFEENLDGDEAEAQAHTPVEPITVFRRAGQIALDPMVAITTRQLSCQMERLGREHGFGGSWTGKLAGGWSTDLANRDYLCVSFDTPAVTIDEFPKVFKATFAGTCMVSIRAYDTPPETILFTLEYGGGFPLNLARAASFGFTGTQKQLGSRHLITTLAKRSRHQDPMEAHEQNLWSAITFAQALGCHPVGEITVTWSDYDRSVRRLGPLGNRIAARSTS